MDRPSARYFSLVVTISVVCIVLGATQWIMTRNDAQFFELDPALSYFPKSEQVTNFTCVASSIAIFLIILSAVVIFTPAAVNLKNYLWKKSLWNVYALQVFTLVLWHLMGFALATLFAQACVGVLKNFAGRARPNAYYMCNYQGYRDAIDSHNMEKYLGLVKANTPGSIGNCLDKEFTNEAFLSFPSGHASMVFASMVYCCYLLRMLLDIRPGVYFSLYALISYLPLAFAAWVSITRVQDHWHHEDDVSIGALIGVVCAGASIATISTYLALDSRRSSGLKIINTNEESRDQNDEDPLLPL